MSGAYQAIAARLYIRALDFPMPHFDVALERCRVDRAWHTIESKCGHDIMLEYSVGTIALLRLLVDFRAGRIRPGAFSTTRW